MTTHIAYVAGAHRCYSTTDGRTKRFLGCSHDTPRAAIRHANGSGDAYVSPLKADATPRTEQPTTAGFRAEATAAQSGAPQGGRETGGGQAPGLRRREHASPDGVETYRDDGLEPSGLAPSVAPGLKNRKPITPFDPSREVPAVIADATRGAPLPAVPATRTAQRQADGDRTARVSAEAEPSGSPEPSVTPTGGAVIGVAGQAGSVSSPLAEPAPTLGL